VPVPNRRGVGRQRRFQTRKLETRSGYEGLYEVSDLGRVRSLDRIVPHRHVRQRRVDGRPMVPVDDAGSAASASVTNLARFERAIRGYDVRAA